MKKINDNKHSEDSFILEEKHLKCPYQVPEGYFEGLSDVVIAHIHIDKHNANISNGYQVPEDYFLHLADIVLEKISTEKTDKNEITEELLSIAPTLASIKREHLYSVPNNYFDTFTVQKQSAKIISLPDKQSRSKMLKGLFIAASILASVLTIGFYTKQSSTTSLIPTKEVDHYASVSSLPTDSLKKADSQVIKSYFSRLSIQNEQKADEIIVPEIKTINVSQEINTISSKDIEEYLNSTPAAY